MRLHRLAAALALMFVAPAAVAQNPSGGGGVGAAIIDDSPATVLEAGLDVSAESWAVGFGGRLVLLADGELRTEDWDQTGEWLTLLRYLRYRRVAGPDELQASVGAGELSDADIGHRSLVDGYASGIDIDHRHLGIQSRAYGRHLGGEVMIDDVAGPRVMAARGYYRPFGDLYVGAQAATDLHAPTAMSDEMVVGLAADVSLWLHRDDRGSSALAYAEVGSWLGLGAGVHLGARGSLRAGEAWTLEADGNLALGSDGYIAGYIDGLYERSRFLHDRMQTQLDRARAGGLGGVSGMLVTSAARDGVGRLELGVGHRAGLGLRTRARLSMAEWRQLQLAASLTSQELAGGTAWTLASELRYLLPAGFYAQAQAAHLYRRQDREVAPAWWTVVGLGLTLGDD